MLTKNLVIGNPNAYVYQFVIENGLHNHVYILHIFIMNELGL